MEINKSVDEVDFLISQSRLGTSLHQRTWMNLLFSRPRKACPARLSMLIRRVGDTGCLRDSMR